MSAKKLAQQKAGPMSPASEEIKADSLGLRNRKETVKATLETIRRIQRQTAKVFSLLGTASITGMSLAGLLLAPFPFQRLSVKPKEQRTRILCRRRPFPCQTNSTLTACRTWTLKATSTCPCVLPIRNGLGPATTGQESITIVFGALRTITVIS